MFSGHPNHRSDEQGSLSPCKKGGFPGGPVLSVKGLPDCHSSPAEKKGGYPPPRQPFHPDSKQENRKANKGCYAVFYEDSYGL